MTFECTFLGIIDCLSYVVKSLNVLIHRSTLRSQMLTNLKASFTWKYTLYGIRYTLYGLLSATEEIPLLPRYIT